MGPVIGTVAAVVGAVGGVIGTIKSVKEQKKAREVQRLQQDLQNRRERRQAIREAQLKRAQATASAQGAGALTGSAGAGGISAINSQLGEALGYASQQNQLSGLVSHHQQRAADANQLASFGSSLFSFGIGEGAFQKSAQVNQAPIPSFNNVSGFFNNQRRYPNYGPPGF